MSRNRIAAALAAVLLVLGAAAPVAAQTSPGPTTSSSLGSLFVPPAQTSTTVATVPPTTVPATTVPAGSSAGLVPVTTTTTAPVPPAIANVPGPPAPAPVAASPADIARANQLEQQIVTQSNVLDGLAEQYNNAQQKVVATAASLDQIRARLARTRADAATARAGLGRAGQTLRAMAVDAYVGLGTGTGTGPDALLRTYQRGTAQAAAETAIGKALTQLTQLHRTEQQLRATEAGILKEQQQAADANSGAQAAAAQARAAARAATTQQEQLLLTVSQVSGNLGPLVAAARAAQAQAAFNRFRVAGGLDFQPGAGLGGPASQAAGAVQSAVAQVGKPYLWGATGPDSFDCSGLVLWAWAKVGIGIPRVAADQQAWATPVPISQLAPGDLVFFGQPAHHVGMYVGGGMMVDAPHSGASVSVVPIWWDDLAGFGRVHSP